MVFGGAGWGFFFGGGGGHSQKGLYFFERRAENIRSLFEYSRDWVWLIPLCWKCRYSSYSRHNAIEPLNCEGRRETSLKGAHLESRNISLVGASPSYFCRLAAYRCLFAFLPRSPQRARCISCAQRYGTVSPGFFLFCIVNKCDFQ